MWKSSGRIGEADKSENTLNLDQHVQEKILQSMETKIVKQILTLTPFSIYLTNISLFEVNKTKVLNVAQLQMRSTFPRCSSTVKTKALHVVQVQVVLAWILLTFSFCQIGLNHYG